jgi:uncharacterized protein YdiU (UPF0061 family)
MHKPALKSSTRGSRAHHPNLVGSNSQITPKDIWCDLLQRVVNEFNSLEDKYYRAIIEAQLGIVTNNGIPLKSVNRITELLAQLTEGVKESLKDISLDDDRYKTTLEELNSYFIIKEYLESHRISE